MWKAKFNLKKAGLLKAVDSIAEQLGDAVKLQWEYDVVVHSDNHLVRLVLGEKLGMSDEEILKLYGVSR